MTPQEFLAPLTGLLMPGVTADFLLWFKLSNKVKVMPIWHVRFRPEAVILDRNQVGMSADAVARRTSFAKLSFRS
jgi:hypothetical protein